MRTVIFLKPPWFQKKKGAAPKPPKTKCIFHPRAGMSHIPCQCNMVVINMDDKWVVTHNGIHNHDVPPMAHRTLPPKSKVKLQQLILSSPKSTSLDLKIGRDTRPSVDKIDPCLSNIWRVQRERFNCAPATNQTSSSIVDIIKFKQKNPGFIKQISILSDPPFILLQDESMLKLLLREKNPLETDTVEGFVEEKSLGEKNQENLTITSCYDSILKRWIPVFISILFGFKKKYTEKVVIQRTL